MFARNHCFLSTSEHSSPVRVWSHKHKPTAETFVKTEALLATNATKQTAINSQAANSRNKKAPARSRGQAGQPPDTRKGVDRNDRFDPQPCFTICINSVGANCVRPQASFFTGGRTQFAPTGGKMKNTFFILEVLCFSVKKANRNWAMPSRRKLPPCSDHQHTTLTTGSRSYYT